MALNIFGSIYAASQTEMRTVDDIHREIEAIVIPETRQN